MPAQAGSLLITDSYRDRLLALRAAAGKVATVSWQRTVAIDDLDGTHPAWVESTAAALEAIQTAGVRLTAAYLTAFLRSELQAPVDGPALDDSAYAGISRTGRPLAEALVPTVITVKKAITAGDTPAVAFQHGQAQAERLAITEAMSTPRTALTDAIRTDPRIVGWRRVTSGGCGACLAAATRTYSDHEPLHVHDGCRCGAEPIIANVADTAHRPDGHQIFAAMTPDAQNEALGAPTADLIRAGRVPLHDLIAVSPMNAIPDQITQAPYEALQAQAA